MEKPVCMRMQTGYENSDAICNWHQLASTHVSSPFSFSDKEYASTDD